MNNPESIDLKIIFQKSVTCYFLDSMAIESYHLTVNCDKYFEVMKNKACNENRRFDNFAFKLK